MKMNKTLIVGIVCSFVIFGFARSSECQPKNVSAKDIIEKMAAQYRDISSYQDTGEVLETKNGANNGRIVNEFKTYFTRPNFLRFEWTDGNIATSGPELNVVWSDGKRTKSYYSWKNPRVETYETIGLGFGGATGISRGSAHTVPTLLLEEIGGFKLTEILKPEIIAEEKFEGENCYIVRGYHPFGFPIDIWIGKKDFLIRKTKEPMEKGLFEVEIRRHVKINEKIPTGIFNFI